MLGAWFVVESGVLGFIELGVSNVRGTGLSSTFMRVQSRRSLFPRRGADLGARDGFMILSAWLSLLHL